MKEYKFDYYAVIQDGFTIYGVGETEEAAIDDAMQYLDSETDRNEIEYGFTNVSGDLCVVPCTQKLYEYVREYGTPNSWEEIRNKGILMKDELEDEEY